jgi:DNA repair protein RecN (Recombination protein N)
MLLELDIRDFAIIDHLRIRYAPGFSVLTGETGAGKSIVVDALAQLLGDRACSELIRSGSDRAQIEGVFEPSLASDRVGALLAEHGIESDAQLILRREIHAGGRSTARVNGRAVPVKALADLGTILVDIHGQSDNASLKREAEHVDLLDRYAGLEAQRRALAGLVGRVRQVTADLERLQQDEAALARRADMLAYQVEQIRTAKLSAEEEADLLTDRTRLANAERLAILADQVYGALRGGNDDQLAALDQIDIASQALGHLVEIDGSLGSLPASLTEAMETLGEAATRLLVYRDALEFDPDRLNEVEDRLAAIADLKRKFGPDVAAVLAYAERAEAELATISNSEERIVTLVEERQRLLAEIGDLAGDLSDQRRQAGQRLAEAVLPELEVLGMPGSAFEVRLGRRPDPLGVPVDGECFAFDETGIDHVSFLVSANPGEPPLPLVRVASGGETARIMLALKTILTGADRTPTLIFDEIDAGIGGRVGAVAGQRLWSLAGRPQVLCVTHLPQVAAFADNHFRVQKAVAAGRTTTEVVPITGEDRVSELTLMLGSPTNIARETAVQLLQQSAVWKGGQRRL